MMVVAREGLKLALRINSQRQNKQSIERSLTWDLHENSEILHEPVEIMLLRVSHGLELSLSGRNILLERHLGGLMCRVGGGGRRW